MVDFEQILRETKENGSIPIKVWANKLAKSDEAAMATMNVVAGACIMDPFIKLALLSEVGPHVCNALMAFAFEAGRLYGRSELVEEMENK